MPIITMFYGIIIRMYNNNEHQPPHFHAFYSGYEAVFSLKGQLLEGKIPNKQKQLIKAWAIIHQDEIEANWSLAINKEPVFKIEPLR